MAKPHSNPLDLFWKRVSKSPDTDGCWPIAGFRNWGGFSRAWNGLRYEQAHRFAYSRLVGEIPEGMYVRHRCQTKHCVRPDHLALAADTVGDRFWSLVQKSDGCWLWMGHRQRYGRFWDGTQQISAHRFAYTYLVGQIPDGLFVCHACDVPACVRPDHLFLGTGAENVADRNTKGRQIRGERHHQATLRTEDVLDIRARFANGETQTAIARSYGVSCFCVSSIVRRNTWRHV